VSKVAPVTEDFGRGFVLIVFAVVGATAVSEGTISFWKGEVSLVDMVDNFCSKKNVMSFTTTTSLILIPFSSTKRRSGKYRAGRTIIRTISIVTDYTKTR
jgi:hypothetical protein